MNSQKEKQWKKFYGNNMNKKIKDGLTKGLLAGYAGGKVLDVNRGGFEGKSSHVELGKDKMYHDEWFVDHHNGGGQELIQIGTEKYTRLYAGGTPAVEHLESLGIAAKEVSAYLIKKIAELADKTRLLEECTPAADGKWHYSYVITGSYPETEVTTGVESITYNDTIVHIHAFIISSVR